MKQQNMRNIPRLVIYIRSSAEKQTYRQNDHATTMPRHIKLC